MYLEWKKWIKQLSNEYVENKTDFNNPYRIYSSSPYDSIQHGVPHIGVNTYVEKLIKKHPYLSINETSFHKKRKFIYFQGSPLFNFIKWEKNPYKKVILSYHPKLPISLVLKNYKIGWDFQFLLLYRKWSIHQISLLIKFRKMDWKLFSNNPYLNFDMLYAFLRFPWNWNTLAIHPAFPPQKVYSDNILFVKWKWKYVYKNPRISLQFWKLLVSQHPNYVSNDPLLLLQNYFQFDYMLQIWAIFKIQSFFLFHVISKKKIIEKTKFILFLKNTFCDDVYFNILSFV